MLHEFITANTPDILARTRAKVAARRIPAPTDARLQNGVPVFLIQLVDRLRRSTLDADAFQKSAALHGGEPLAMGFTVSQVGHGYGDVCQVITQLASELNTSISAEELKTFHLCLDDAMAHSVTRAPAPTRRLGRQRGDRALRRPRAPAPPPAHRRDAGVGPSPHGKRGDGRQHRRRAELGTRPRRS